MACARLPAAIIAIRTTREEVEVLQGPSSVTFGRGSTGGVENQATKTPQLQRFVRGDVDFGTDATRRLADYINTLLRAVRWNTPLSV